MLTVLLIAMLLSFSNDNWYILKDTASSLDLFALFNHLFVNNKLLIIYMIVLTV